MSSRICAFKPAWTQPRSRKGTSMRSALCPSIELDARDAVVARLWQFGRSRRRENHPVDGRRTRKLAVIVEAMQARTPRVLILVENLSVPRDKRVWPECLTLRDSGFEVVVVCPQGEPNDTASFERVDGVEIHRYPARFAEGGALAYLREYATSLWRMSRLAWRAAGRRGFDVVHAANPPDLLLL